MSMPVGTRVLFRLVSFVEFGMGGDKDAAHAVYVAGDTLLETEVAFRGHADCFHKPQKIGWIFVGDVVQLTARL